MGEDDQRCPECGFLACICFDDDEDDQPEYGFAFDCPSYVDGDGRHCPLVGSEDCDWECPHGGLAQAHAAVEGE